MRGEGGIPYELKYESADGQLKIVEVHSRPILSGGKVIGLLGIVRNITERKQAEALLRQRKARYRAVVEDQEEMICRFLPDSTLTFVNDAYFRYFGKSKDELLGKEFLPLITDEDREMVAKRIAALSKEKPSEMQVSILEANLNKLSPRSRIGSPPSTRALPRERSRLPISSDRENQPRILRNMREFLRVP